MLILLFLNEIFTSELAQIKYMWNSKCFHFGCCLGKISNVLCNRQVQSNVNLNYSMCFVVMQQMTALKICVSLF